MEGKYKMKPLNKRNQYFKSSKIREMTILSNQYHAINLAQGFPEFDPPEELTSKLQSIAKDEVHQYAPNWGIDLLRERIAAKQEKSTKRSLNPKTEVLVTCGSTEAMICVQMALINEGDKVAMFSPYYNSYEANALITGAEPVFVELAPPEFKLDEAKLEEALKQGVKALILCNPSNPCGKVFTEEELLTIAGLAEKYDIYVVTDEVYEHIIFEPYKHISFASLPGMFDRTVTCSSLSKTYSVTGWRLGYVTGPAVLLEEIRKYHDFFTVCAPAPLQEAAVTALNFTDEYYRELQKIYTQKRERFIRGLDEIGIPHTTPEGTYFVMADISEFGFDSDDEFSKFLIKEYGVAGVPGSCFFSDHRTGYIRFHFAKNDDTIDEVIRRLGKLKKDHGR